MLAESSTIFEPSKVVNTDSEEMVHGGEELSQ